MTETRGRASLARLPPPEPVAAVFEAGADRYDAWYDTPRGRAIFAAERAALAPLLTGLPRPWLEVGVGGGRFASALGVQFGVDPAGAALALARRRGVAASRRCSPVGRRCPSRMALSGPCCWWRRSVSSTTHCACSLRRVACFVRGAGSCSAWCQPRGRGVGTTRPLARRGTRITAGRISPRAQTWPGCWRRPDSGLWACAPPCSRRRARHQNRQTGVRATTRRPGSWRCWPCRPRARRMKHIKGGRHNVQR